MSKINNQGITLLTYPSKTLLRQKCYIANYPVLNPVSMGHIMLATKW
jgi:hypothetical protein